MIHLFKFNKLSIIKTNLNKKLSFFGYINIFNFFEIFSTCKYKYILQVFLGLYFINLK
jgi:hypothetical protein